MQLLLRQLKARPYGFIGSRQVLVALNAIKTRPSAEHAIAIAIKSLIFQQSERRDSHGSHAPTSAGGQPAVKLYAAAGQAIAVQPVAVQQPYSNDLREGRAPSANQKARNASPAPKTARAEAFAGLPRIRPFR